jgi:hypothetical protein
MERVGLRGMLDLSGLSARKIHFKSWIRGEFDRIVWCGLGGVGFVHSTTVHQPSRTKRSSSKSVFGFNKRILILLNE